MHACWLGGVVYSALLVALETTRTEAQPSPCGVWERVAAAVGCCPNPGSLRGGLPGDDGKGRLGLRLPRLEVLVHQLAVLLRGELFVVMDWDADLLRSERLRILVMELAAIGMGEPILGFDPLVRVVFHHLLHQVDGVVRRLRVQRPPIVATAVAGLGRRRLVERHERALAVRTHRPHRERHRIEHLERERTRERRDVLRGGRSDHLANLLELVERRRAREHGLAAEHLAENASQ